MRVRAAASAGLVLLAATALTGCGLLVPQSTQKQYTPGNGVAASIGELDLRNVVAIAGDTSTSTGDANLVMTAVNTSDSTLSLRVQYTSGEKRKNLTVKVAPGSNKVGYGSDGQLLLTGFHAEAGSLAKIYFQYGSEQGVQLQVPVLNDSWAIYSTLGPTPSPTVTNPPVTPAPLPSATPN